MTCSCGGVIVEVHARRWCIKRYADGGCGGVWMRGQDGLWRAQKGGFA